MYRIIYTDGRHNRTFVDYDAAVDAAEKQYPEGVVGHDGDLSEGGDRTLIWATEADSVNDPGRHAVAEIRKIDRIL